MSGVGLVSPNTLHAQCPGSIQTITYDTTYGNTVTNPNNLVEESFNYSLPQYPINSNTLMAVVLQSYVTVNATVVAQNTSSSDVPFPFISEFRSDGVNSTPLKDFSDFTGGGNIALIYSDNNIPLPSSGLTVTSTTITDQIQFQITYYFCSPGVLATDILTFTAVKENDQTALLSWTASNEQQGREYYVEVSKDAKDFADSAKLPARDASGDAAYTYNYPLEPDATGTLYFRIRVTDPCPTWCTLILSASWPQAPISCARSVRTPGAPMFPRLSWKSSRRPKITITLHRER